MAGTWLLFLMALFFVTLWGVLGLAAYLVTVLLERLGSQCEARHRQLRREALARHPSAVPLVRR